MPLNSSSNSKVGGGSLTGAKPRASTPSSVNRDSRSPASSSRGGDRAEVGGGGGGEAGAVLTRADLVREHSRREQRQRQMMDQRPPLSSSQSDQRPPPAKPQQQQQVTFFLRYFLFLYSFALSCGDILRNGHHYSNKCFIYSLFPPGKTVEIFCAARRLCDGVKF